MRGSLPLYCAAIAAAIASAGWDVPTPARAPASWELKFSFSDPQRITLTLPGDDRPTTYWYMRYTVENDTGQDIQFFPLAELVTSSLEVVAAGADISPTVYDAIREKHKVIDPFMVEPFRVMGTLLQGEDNAKTSIAVFRQFDLKDNEFTIYFSGLSGEVQRVPNPNFDRKKPEDDANPRVFTLRKTLAIEYKLPGDPQARRQGKPLRVNRTWTMR